MAVSRLRTFVRGPLKIVLAAMVAALATAMTPGVANAYPTVCSGSSHVGSHTTIEVLQDVGTCLTPHRIIEIRATYNDQQVRFGHFEVRGPQGHIANSPDGNFPGKFTHWAGPANTTVNGLYCVIFWQKPPSGGALINLDTNCVTINGM